MRKFLAACLFLLLFGCGDKAKDLYDTAQLEEKQFNKPHAAKLYRQILEQHPDSPYAKQAKTRLTELEKARSTSIMETCPRFLFDRLLLGIFFLGGCFLHKNSPSKRSNDALLCYLRLLNQEVALRDP